MKPINEMTLAECLEELSNGSGNDYMSFNDTRKIADRIHKLTRWIPISERMPTRDDGDRYGRVLVFERGKYTPHGTYTRFVGWDSLDDVDYFYTVTHWKRITPPENNP
jgi:hypothetical protein